MQSLDRIVQIFRRRKVITLKTIASVIEGRSTRSLFRDLRRLGCLTSFSHAGKYYTLRNIVTFDENGLWFFRGEIGFSRFGTLKATVAAFVEESEKGYYQRELVAFLRVRVHNPLLELTGKGRIARKRTRRGYLYLCAAPSKAIEQVRLRESHQPLAESTSDEARRSSSCEIVIAVLVEALHLCETEVEPAVLAQRLAVKGRTVSVSEVEAILDEHGLTGKKTIPPILKPSRP